MRKWFSLALFCVCIAIGYVFRGEFGRNATFWVIGGIFSLVVALKLVQTWCQQYVKRKEAAMSPEELRDFEDYKRR